MPSTVLLGRENAGLQRILVIDDDAAILRLVKDKLEGAGFEVATATSGGHAFDVINRVGMPHLAIVDINMPGMNGLEFCQKIQEYSDLPIIMLTAVDEEDTIIRTISQYAEDYVTKPFSPRELLARVERVLRRMGDYAYTLDPVTRIDEHLSVDFAHQQVFIRNQSVPLTPTESKLLYILMRNAGRVVTADFLLRRLWPMEEVFEDTLRVHIHRLRHKIEPVPSQPHYVCTERGLGYSFPHAQRDQRNIRCNITLLSIVSRGSALRLPWATARDRPYHETLSKHLYMDRWPIRKELEGIMATQQSPIVPQVEAPREVDRIREIIFGTQMRDYDQRFEAMVRDVERLQRELNQLNEQLVAQSAAQTKNLQEARQESRAAEADLRTHLRQQIDQVSAQLTDKDAAQSQNLQALRQELRTADSALRDELRQAAQRLTNDKVDRAVLGDLFIELGTQIKGDSSLADMLKGLGRGD